MRSEDLFCAALGLNLPWYVKSVELLDNADSPHRELHINIDFKSGHQFTNSQGESCSTHDTVNKTWQHLNFFEHRCFLHARVPRVKDQKTGKVETIKVPWARPGSGFTLMFEALVMCFLENEMPVNRVAEMFHVNAHRLWRIFNHYVEKSLSEEDLSAVKNIGIDETSSRKGHRYVTVVVDMDKKRTTYVTQGKDSSTLEKYAKHLVKKGGDPLSIELVSMDMSPAFINGIGNYFPNAKIVFDKFHIIKIVNEALDKIRRLESKETELLKGHRYTFLKNRTNLSEKKQAELELLIKKFPTLGQAYRLRELLQDIWRNQDSEQAIIQLEAWCDLALDLKTPAFNAVVKTFKAHWSGIIQYFKNRITNAILENINLKIQSAKRRARGFRNITYFINMIYFLTAKLNFYPLKTA